MHEHQADQQQRQQDDVQCEEAVQRNIGNREVATDDFDQSIADDRNGAEQRNDHLCSPVRHLPPGKQVAGEAFGHQDEEDQHADQPHEFARLLVRAVQHCTEHVQVNDDEEERCTSRMHVANKPAPFDITHDVFDRSEGFSRRRLVVHRQEDAGDQLDRQHHECEHTEDKPPVEVLRCIVLGDVLLHRFGQREALVDPFQQAALRLGCF